MSYMTKVVSLGSQGPSWTGSTFFSTDHHFRPDGSLPGVYFPGSYQSLGIITYNLGDIRQTLHSLSPRSHHSLGFFILPDISQVHSQEYTLLLQSDFPCLPVGGCARDIDG